MAWLEFIGGALVALAGLMYVLDAAMNETSDTTPNRHALYAWIALVIGTVIAVVGFVQLMTELSNWMFR